MRKFVVDLMTNRFGIVLAALNVCYLVSRKFVHYAFSHGSDECFYFKNSIFFWIKSNYAEIMFNINLPAALASLIQSKLTQTIFSDFCFFTDAKIQIVFLAVFITLQWLFIGWMAKTLASAIQPKQD
ncbi:MAG TPA: hypothetical protein VF556_07145 [Pyrinomonadaceae bacterium]|jgi:hypothetical protein